VKLFDEDWPMKEGRVCAMVILVEDSEELDVMEDERVWRAAGREVAVGEVRRE
jgi:hypothetical protein